LPGTNTLAYFDSSRLQPAPNIARTFVSIELLQISVMFGVRLESGTQEYAPYVWNEAGSGAR
jgi:hypothetical protein